MRLATNLFQGLNILVSKMIENTDSNSLLNELKELFDKKGRFVKGKLVPTYNLKIVRSHKMAEVERDDSGRAWFVGGETHTNFIENNLTYSDEENDQLTSIEQAFALAVPFEK